MGAMHEDRHAVSRFFRWNERLSQRIERRLRIRTNLFQSYRQTVEEVLRRPGTLVDVGGGRSSPVAASEKRSNQTHVVALDVSLEELYPNVHADSKVASDAVRGLPFRDGSVDVLVSSAVLEHLVDVDAFVGEGARVLRPGGSFIHLFPGRYSSFATVNRLLGPKWSNRLLFLIRPHARGICGFRAYYDRTYHSAMSEILPRHGLEVERIDADYYGSGYYRFFFPLYLVSLLYELILYALRPRNLAAYYLVIAKKTT